MVGYVVGGAVGGHGNALGGLGTRSPGVPPPVADGRVHGKPIPWLSRVLAVTGAATSGLALLLILVAAVATVALLVSAAKSQGDPNAAAYHLLAGLLAPTGAVLVVTVVGMAGVGQLVMAVLGIVAR